MTWHVEPRVLEAYAGGNAPEAHAYSIEAHIVECDVCRGLLGRYVDRGRLDSVWSDIADAIALRPKSLMERLLLRAGVKDHAARLLTATPSLHMSWFAGIALVLAFAVGAAHLSDGGFAIFLVLAPMLPLAGIAVAFGPGVDPTYEIGLAAPMRSFHLLAIRATAVLATSFVMALCAALALPVKNWAIVAWLLPSMCLSLISLALSTVISPLHSAAAVAIIWVMGCGIGIATVGGASTVPHDFFLSGSMQLVLAALTLIAGVLVYDRREIFEQGGR